MSATLREAEQWCERIHSRECTPDQRAEFLEWLYEDPRHGEAYAQAERTNGRSRLDFSLQRGLKYEYG